MNDTLLLSFCQEKLLCLTWCVPAAEMFPGPCPHSNWATVRGPPGVLAQAVASPEHKEPVDSNHSASPPSIHSHHTHLLINSKSLDDEQIIIHQNEMDFL